MRIILAPDSFKGSLTAPEAAQAMARGLQRIFPHAIMDCLPVADGGEGTVTALVAATNGCFQETVVRNPLLQEIVARWGLLGDGSTAVIEMAAASGWGLLQAEELAPQHTCTCGTGELIKAALDKGAKRVIIGIGGSATNDGGIGAIRALGGRFLNSAGQELTPGGAALAHLAHIDLASLDPRLEQLTLHVACDVDNPLCGAHGASAVYGPQKGATPEMVHELDAALMHYATIAQQHTGRDIATQAGAGAAGGLGAAFLYFTPATLVAGAELVLDVMNFAKRIQGASLVITGEGSTDAQTAFGKAPAAVARAAKAQGIPVICLSGVLGKGAERLLHKDVGMDALMAISPGPLSLVESIANAAQLVEQAAERLGRLVSLGAQVQSKK